MKKIYIIYIIFTKLIFCSENYLIDDFNNNNNNWYTNTNKFRNIEIKNGNYIINNLDKKRELFLTSNSDIKDFCALEYKIKNLNEESAYGIFIELYSNEKFYLIFEKNKIAYVYEKNKKYNLLKNFQEFPYIFKDYNSVTLIKDSDNFTFLINEIPTEQTWRIKNSKIKKIGLYLDAQANLYLDKFTMFQLEGEL